jgi:phage terminase Nu1 subunit (DNA packaging protein)
MAKKAAAAPPPPPPLRDALVSASELADLVGASVKTIDVHAAKGALDRVARGKYRLGPSLAGYCEQLRNAASGRPGASSDARTRLLEAQANLVETKTQAMNGELLPAGEVERHWSGILRGVRAGILAIPSRVAGRVPELSRVAIEEIDAELRAVLTELSEHDFKPASREGEGEAEPEAPAAAEAQPVD